MWTKSTNGTRNWGTVLRNSSWVKINNHSHTGSGDGNQLGKASLVPGSIDGEVLSPNLGLTTAPDTDVTGLTADLDWNTGNNQAILLENATGDVAVSLQNPVQGARYRIKLVQGTTPRLLTWPANVLFPGGEEPSQFMAASVVALVVLEYDGVNYLSDWQIDYQ